MHDRGYQKGKHSELPQQTRLETIWRHLISNQVKPGLEFTPRWPESQSKPLVGVYYSNQ